MLGRIVRHPNWTAVHIKSENAMLLAWTCFLFDEDGNLYKAERYAAPGFMKKR